jgi:NADPH2:quinone reductase
MGLEIAGKIKHIGKEAAKKSKWKLGDKVCALLGGGGYAEYVSVKYDMLMPVPKGLSLVEASALPEAFATSYLNLFWEGNLKKGDAVYIPAGASGLASVAIPMAKAFGARVITSVLSDEIAQSITHLGADIIVNSRKQNIADVFKQEMKSGHPVNVAMDCLGGESLGNCLQYMAVGGTWVLISTLAGISTSIALRPVLTKGLRLVGSMLRNRAPEMKARILRELVENVWPKIENGEIRPTIYKILPIIQAEEAHGILERNENVGKVVLLLKEER